MKTWVKPEVDLLELKSTETGLKLNTTTLNLLGFSPALLTGGLIPGGETNPGQSGTPGISC